MNEYAPLICPLCNNNGSFFIKERMQWYTCTCSIGELVRRDIQDRLASSRLDYNVDIAIDGKLIYSGILR